MHLELFTIVAGCDFYNHRPRPCRSIAGRDKQSLAIQARVLLVLTDPHTGKALVIANQSRNVRSNIKRSVNSAVRAAYRSLAAFFIDLRPK